ncbi:hypothetical protein KDA00_01210 [Candidatus Saccharibacteria bacterium]|nr:hypothetical protein [Candidatus Saccharibacteria bacterium]
MNDHKKTPQDIRQVEQRVVKELEKNRDSAYEKFPLLFTMLGAFGVVATFYGFEHIIDNIDLFADNPFILLGVGVSTLVLTGTLYKKLG